MSSSSAVPAPPATPTARVLFLAAAIAVIVSNLYASQPLIGLIAPALGLGPAAASLTTTVTLLGYAAGLVFLVPLIDLVPHRPLIVGTLACAVAALLLSIVAPTPALFLIASAAVGVTTTAVQMLLTVAANLASATERGRVVGTAQSGIVIGVLLSRPAASLVAEFCGWRAFYGLTAVLIAIIAVVLARMVEARRPAQRASYPALVRSLGTLIVSEPILRQRALNQVLLMGAFGAFWTAVALRLAAPPFDFGQRGIALFALAGVSGALIAPLAGRIADRGWSDRATTLAHVVAVAGIVVAGLAADGPWALHASTAWPAASLAALTGAAVLLDLGLFADQTLGRIAINTVRPEARGRLNALYTGLFFIGGAAGAALAGLAWSWQGWAGVCWVGLGFTLAAVIAGRGTRRQMAPAAVTSRP
ncbi:MFS transporter [Bradyrhizobium sp. 2TAF24]|uniref:MFS transporter n=1 Tax=Bradyrhizobium sp. 2TAF24 TaxID=3233011 RepID=UPI003F909FBE